MQKTIFFMIFLLHFALLFVILHHAKLKEIYNI